MSRLRRRLLRAFIEAGGDLTEPREVQRLQRFVVATLPLLPSKVRLATELIWREAGLNHERLAARLSERDEQQLSPAATRQRASRGVRLLESAIRRRVWSPSPPGNPEDRKVCTVPPR